eukprot:CCRYP_007252-RA/>CCRYP_007252-RA protein AED:0.14 eAED:0.15 QI:0/0/0/1/1/1/2/0/1534
MTDTDSTANNEANDDDDDEAAASGTQQQKDGGSNPLMTAYFNDSENGDDKTLTTLDHWSGEGRDGTKGHNDLSSMQNEANLERDEEMPANHQIDYSDNKRTENSNQSNDNSNESNSSSNNNSNNEELGEKNKSNNSNETSDTSSLLAEAERQAAIAAALSQTSGNSPSVVAGLARQLATGSIVRGYGPTVVALPPLPPDTVASDGAGATGSVSANGAASTVAAGSGTMASGPASRLATPVPLPVTMKPVRFDHVKVVFAKLLREELKKDGGNGQEREEEEESSGGGRQESPHTLMLREGDGAGEASIRADESQEESLPHAMHPIVVHESILSNGENDGNESSEESVSTDAKEQLVERESQSVVDGTPSQNMTAADCNDDALSSLSSTTTAITATQQSPPSPERSTTTTIPDSFLRFLLLVARVPIIVEEGKKKQLHRQKKRFMADSEANALAAAKRIMEIYKCAQDCYEQIEERRRKKMSKEGDGKGDDATTAFFASCAGEMSGMNANSDETLKNNNNSYGEDGSKNMHRPSSPKHYKAKRRNSFSTSTSSSSNVTSSAAVTAMVSASSIFSNVISKVSKKQHTTLSDIGKKLMSGNVSLHRENETPSSSPRSENDAPMEDYEIIIDQEMLGLTVENVLERTIIRTLLPEGAAKRAGAKVGSLIAKVGNVDTSNLTHFETIDELRQSQRPLKLTLRHISADVLRCAREEMGRLIRGREEEGGGGNNRLLEGDKPWRDGSHHGVVSGGENSNAKETFDSILRDRWPSKIQRSTLIPTATSASVMTRAEMIHRAGKDLIRILALMVVGMEKEFYGCNVDSESSSSSLSGSLSSADVRRKQLTEGIEITSKILLEYARKHPDVNEKFKPDRGSGSSIPSTSFYPVPPGRVSKRNAHPPPPPPGKGQKNRKGPDETPLLRIGDALHRTTSFLVEPSSTTAITLRWEIIDYLCVVLDLDSENELAEKEAASSTSQGGDASQITDLGSAGSILKLIVVNCSTTDNDSSVIESADSMDGESMSTFGRSSSRSSGRSSYSGNQFISVVHRLAASKSTSARVSACSLGPVLWSHLDFPRQLQLRGVITRALHDVEMTVRKSTATVLHEVAELVFDRRSVPWLVLMCERSMTDPEPQLRAAAMTLTWHLAEHLPNAFLGDASKGSRSLRRLPPRTDPTFMDVYLLQCKLLPVASNLAEDKMPSVRLSVAAQCDRLCSALGEHWFSVIIDLLQALLSDGDERVRSEAVLCMPRLVESVVVGTSKVDDDLASISSHQSFQSHTSYDRRKPVFIPVLSEEQVLRLLPTLSNLATSKEWRVRQSAVEIVPALLGCTYRHETRQEISKFCLKLMSDKVDAVRKTAAECLCLGGSSLARHGEDDGGAWITNIVIPHLKTCSQSEDSKQRLLCLKMIEIIITNGLCPAPQRRADSNSRLDISLNSSFDTTSDSFSDVESTVKLILDIAAPLASDKVANVRLNVGRVFGSIMFLLDRTDANFAMTVLEKQLEDEKNRAGGGDRDVIYFSQQAMLVLHSPRRCSSYEGQHFVE